MSVSDYRAIGRLAWPLILSGAIEASFNLTDTWFVGRLSTDAMAALASVAWLDYCGVLLFGGLAMAVQTRAAQAYGAGRSA
ncbi:MAG: MATE family efflux transporter, partial [Steroidobacteraceae bacterium]